MEVRKFEKKKKKGEEYSLMDIENYGLLTEPQGLGFEYSIDYEKIGNMFVENKRTLNQNVITGTYNTIGYENYYKFVNFIEKSVSLRLHYVIPYENNLAEYYKDVVVLDYNNSLFDEYLLLVKCMHLTRHIAVSKEKDLSGVDYNPVVKKLYKFNGNL